MVDRATNLKGRVFGKLTVIARAENAICGGKKVAMWKCLCECGNVEIKRAGNLRAGFGVRCRDHWKKEVGERTRARYQSC